MNLWLLCCVLLFITSQGYSWLSQQAWFVAPDLGLPWILLAGTGLAIASNRHAFQKSVSATQQKTELTTQGSRAAGHNPPAHGPSSAIAPPKQSSPRQAHPAKKPSISFEISQRRSGTTN
jgi:uncharacterized membrane protein